MLCTAALPPERSLAEVLAYLHKTAGAGLQVLCLAAGDDLQLRLAARRAGCVGLHPLPLHQMALTEALAVFAPQADVDTTYRVLVVEDVPLEAIMTAQVLPGAATMDFDFTAEVPG